VKAYYDKKSGIKIQEFTTAKAGQQPKVIPTSATGPALAENPPSR
jgi:hypothetical protein